jgi:hypothetical protein
MQLKKMKKRVQLLGMLHDMCQYLYLVQKMAGRLQITNSK